MAYICPECHKASDVKLRDRARVTCPNCKLMSASDHWIRERASKPGKQPSPQINKRVSASFRDLVSKAIAAGLFWIGLIFATLSMIALGVHFFSVWRFGWEPGDQWEGVLCLAGFIQSLMITAAGIIIDRLDTIAKQS